jgi:hypothetical protein
LKAETYVLSAVALILNQTRKVLVRHSPDLADLPSFNGVPLLSDYYVAMRGVTRRLRIDSDGLNSLRDFAAIWDERSQAFAEGRQRLRFTPDEVEEVQRHLNTYKSWLKRHFEFL